MANIPGNRTCCISGGVRCTRQCKVTGGMMWMNRLPDSISDVIKWPLKNHLVTLSKEWKTIEFLHIAIATALLPYAKQ